MQLAAILGALPLEGGAADSGVDELGRIGCGAGRDGVDNGKGCEDGEDGGAPMPIQGWVPEGGVLPSVSGAEYPDGGRGVEVVVEYHNVVQAIAVGVGRSNGVLIDEANIECVNHSDGVGEVELEQGLVNVLRIEVATVPRRVI